MSEIRNRAPFVAFGVVPPIIRRCESVSQSSRLVRNSKQSGHECPKTVSWDSETLRITWDTRRNSELAAINRLSTQISAFACNQSDGVTATFTEDEYLLSLFRCRVPTEEVGLTTPSVTYRVF